MFPEFEDACFADHYNILCRRLIQEKFLDGHVPPNYSTLRCRNWRIRKKKIAGLRTFVARFVVHADAEAASA